jgi:opacity protein-like surface antigen
MKQATISTPKKYISTALIIFSAFITTNTFASAFEAPSWWATKSWHPFGAIGGGADYTSNLGYSQNFPINNPTTDEFYNYTAHQQGQTVAFFDFLLGAEWHPYQDWFFELGADYNQTTSLTANGTFVQGADVQSENNYNYSFNAISRQILAEGKLLYTIADTYHPYLTLGLGAAFNNAYSYTTNVPPNLTFTRQYADHTSKNFSYAVGFGLDMDITPDFRFGIGYRFADVGQVQLGNASIDTTSVNGTLSQMHLYNNQVLAQITYVD